jgi:hypothetical protein
MIIRSWFSQPLCVDNNITFADKESVLLAIRSDEKTIHRMISQETFRQFALSLPETDEHPHFENTAFRVKKKIFATLNLAKNLATLKFSLENQDVFSAISQGAIFPVPNKWGHHGWTHIDLSKAEWDLCQDAMQCAWCEVAPPKLLAKHPELSDE